jgi:hypothetical protein
MKKKSTPKPVEKKPAPTTSLEHCNFYGVHWDAAATEAVQTVAEGLLANAKAMDKLIDVFKAQNVQINNMLHIN